MRAPLLGFFSLVLGLAVGCSSGPAAEDDTEQNLEASQLHFTTEAEIAAGKFEGAILDYWKVHAKRGSFVGTMTPRGKQPKIVYDVVAPEGESQGALVISHGVYESSVKYAELVYDLHRNGLPFTAYVINHRGQGFSDRLLDDPLKCHVDKFDDYAEDLHTFVKEVVHPETQKNTFAFAHSMGGGIMTRYLELYPNEIKTVVLSSPMHGVNTGWVPGFAARILLDGVGPFIPTDNFPQSAPDVPYSSSPARSKISSKVLELYPEVNLQGVTWGWLKSGLDTTRGAMKSDAKNVTANIKMFRAKPDDLVDPDGQDSVCNAINKGGKGTCDMKTFDTAKHEVWNERDEIRDVVLTETLAFYKSKTR